MKKPSNKFQPLIPTIPEKLPKGWVKTTLGEVCLPVATVQPESSPNTEFTYFDIGGIDNETNRIAETKTVTGSEAPGRARQAAQIGDILFSTVRTYLKKIARIERDYPNPVASTGFTVIRAAEGVSSKLLFYQVLSEDFLQPLHALQTGSSYPAVRDKDVFAQPISIPPTREQERIVLKLDAMLQRIEAGESAAHRALVKLDHYRSTILNAAVTGELTRKWRKSHKPTEDGKGLLKRLLHERRALWEKTELERLHAASKPPKTDKWKERYDEPAPPNTNGLPELPTGWTWASLGQLLSLLRNGIGTPPNDESGLPVLRISAVRPMFVNLNERRYFPKSLIKKFEEFTLNEGDLLFTRYNGSRDLAGVCGRVPALNETVVHPDKLIRCVVVPGFLPLDQFVEIAANCGVSRKTIADSLRTTAGQWGLSGATLKEIPIPLPPIDEQEAIVSQLERRFTSAERLTATLKRQLNFARKTRQSLLREAFAGRLVPQDPKDESASASLKRIRATREAHNNQPKARHRQRMPQKKPAEPKPKLPTSDDDRKTPNLVAPISIQPVHMSPHQVKLLSLKLYQDYNSLKASTFRFRHTGNVHEKLSPICFVGLNGSGKSNLIEALSEIFCHVELSLLPWKEIKKTHRVVDLCFDLEYQVIYPRASTIITVRLEKPDQHPATFKVIRNGKEEVVKDPSQCLALLPTRIVGYSSGLNETISIPYFRTAAVYSDEVLKQANLEEQEPDKHLSDVLDSRTFYLDYECNALILIANYLLQPKSRLRIFRRYLRIDSLSTFDIRFRPTYQGKKPVKLTAELHRYVAAIRACADSVERDPESKTEIFRFTNPTATAARLKSAFESPSSFFRALYKLSLLNPLALKGKKRVFFLRDDVRVGQLERPPTISRVDRIFSVENICVNLTNPKRPIDYAGISDGEHQFMQIFGSVILFDEPGCVFLLDEPETHFNPQWRRLSIQWLAKFKATMRQELIISTHSPFVVSGCRGRNVFKFGRIRNLCECSAIDFETFGASYDFLLSRLFAMESMIAEEAIDEMRELIKSSSIKKLLQALPHFGESLEKRFIFERISQLEARKKHKR